MAVSKAALAVNSTKSTADTEYGKLTDPNVATPSPPVHAARLSALLKNLSSAESAVSESIKARHALIEGLEKILETNRTALVSEQSQHYEVTSRKSTIEAKKRDVEDGIMRDLSAEPPTNGSPGIIAQTNGKNPSPSVEPERPRVEELTPPPFESLTPAGSPTPLDHEVKITTTTGADIIHEQQPDHTEPPPATQPPLIAPAAASPLAGADLLSSLSLPPVRSYSGSPSNGSVFKKRKMEPGFAEMGTGDAMEGLDEDVAELLRAESGGH